MSSPGKQLTGMHAALADQVRRKRVTHATLTAKLRAAEAKWSALEHTLAAGGLLMKPGWGPEELAEAILAMWRRGVETMRRHMILDPNLTSGCGVNWYEAPIPETYERRAVAMDDGSKRTLFVNNGEGEWWRDLTADEYAMAWAAIKVAGLVGERLRRAALSEFPCTHEVRT